MNLTTDQIVVSLIAFYKRNGVDLTYLLGDPTFQSLKTAEKVEAIKAHAAELHAGSSDALTKEEKTAILTDAVFTALPAAGAAFALLRSPLAKTLNPSLHLGGVGNALMSGAIMGLGIGGVRAGIAVDKARSDRKAVRSELRNAMNNPGPDSAVSVLAASAIRNHVNPLRYALADRARSLMEDPDMKGVALGAYRHFYDTGPQRGFSASPLPDNFSI